MSNYVILEQYISNENGDITQEEMEEFLIKFLDFIDEYGYCANGTIELKEEE